MLILNVDDDSDDLEMFREAANAVDPKIEFLQFDSGKKVLEYLMHVEVFPNYLFIDMNMPKMNGYECIEHIRKIPGSKNMSIIMYITSFNPIQQDIFKDLDIKYLKKSNKFSDLVQAIEMIISESKEVVEIQKK